MNDHFSLDCSCCKDKIPQVQEILDEMHRIMGPVEPTETQTVLAQLGKISRDKFGGEIDDIVALSEAFFKIPWEAFSIEDLQLQDETKKVGKFLVKDLSDVPGLDVTRALDLSKFDTSKLETLKFSLSVPTISASKSITFPLLNIGMRFLVSRKEFSFMPILDLGVKTKEDALKRIKGVKMVMPVTSATDVNTAKKIALENYSTSKEVREAVINSQTTHELITRLSTLGVCLFEEIDVEKQVQGFLKNEDLTNSVPVYDDLDCGNPGVTFAPFDEMQLKEIEKDCCSEDRTQIVDDTPYDTIEEQLDKLNTPAVIDEATMLADLDMFLGDTSAANDILQKCAKEKANAVNSYYWFLETSFINNIVLEYVKERYRRYDELQNSNEDLEKEKVRLLSLKVEEKKRLDSLRSKRWFNSGYSSLQDYEAAINILTQQISTIDQDILTVSQKIEDLGKFISDKATEYFPIFTSTQNQVFLFRDPIGDKFDAIRTKFSIRNNPITDQAGYETMNDIGAPVKPYLKLRVFPFILDECKSLFALNSPRTGEFASYQEMLTFRNGDLADKIWNAFYSYKRIDTFFTYQEQGFKTPKPQYNDKGEPIGETQKLKVKSAAGGEIDQNISKDVVDLEIDIEVAKNFWPNLENNMKEKVNLFLIEYAQSKVYTDYIDFVKSVAREDAEFAFATGSYFGNTTTNSSSTTTSVSFGSTRNDYTVKKFSDYFKSATDSVQKYQDALMKKVSDLDIFIQDRNKCIAEQEQAIIDLSQAYARKMGTPLSPSPEKTDCWSKLGSDPMGVKRPNDCPGVTKNCYWQEYTNLIQQVSLMPIPDDAATGQLTKRLFRYYGVGIQIPVPTPTPAVLPTLASGIPDPMISIPMPLIWKHIISINSPIGLFVIWIAICGPVPGPYIMYVDENVDPCFLVTPKGPISIPAKSLLVPPTDDTALIDFLPIKNLFKVPLEFPAFNKLVGSLNFSSTDPDSIDNFIGKIQSKIKAAVDSIEVTDPWTLSLNTPEAVAELKSRVNKSLRNFPPDIDSIQEAFDIVSKSLDEQVDSLDIKPIKFPVNPKKLVTPIIGPVEFMESVNKLIDAGTQLSEIGLGIPTISLREKVKILTDRELSSPEVKEKFLKINQAIANFESNFRLSGALPDGATDVIQERAKYLKEAIKAPLEVVASKITPEMLGFISMITIPVPLPFPCFDNIIVEPFPPYILELVAAISELPSSIEALPIEQIAGAISAFIDLSVPLPRVEDCIFFVIQSFLAVVPDLRFPDPASATQFKQLVLSAVQNLFKIKIRMPHTGIPQISIPSSMIKAAIKSAISAAFAAVTSMAMRELNNALQNNDFVKVLAVAGIIKGMFGTDLGSISGEDIKSFVTASLGAIDAQLESIKAMIPNVPSVDFKSIKESLFPTIPPKLKLPWLTDGPFMEISTLDMLELSTPLLQALIDAPLPLPVVLLGASQLPGRAVMSKLHPFSPKEILPSWEKLSSKNLPFVIWLDQLVATAQKQSGIGSNYVIPYWLPDV